MHGAAELGVCGPRRLERPRVSVRAQAGLTPSRPAGPGARTSQIFLAGDTPRSTPPWGLARSAAPTFQSWASLCLSHRGAQEFTIPCAPAFNCLCPTPALQLSHMWPLPGAQPCSGRPRLHPHSTLERRGSITDGGPGARPVSAAGFREQEWAVRMAPNGGSSLSPPPETHSSGHTLPPTVPPSPAPGQRDLIFQDSLFSAKAAALRVGRDASQEQQPALSLLPPQGPAKQLRSVPRAWAGYPCLSRTPACVQLCWFSGWSHTWQCPGVPPSRALCGARKGKCLDACTVSLASRSLSILISLTCQLAHPHRHLLG